MTQAQTVVPPMQEEDSAAIKQRPPQRNGVMWLRNGKDFILKFEYSGDDARSWLRKLSSTSHSTDSNAIRFALESVCLGVTRVNFNGLLDVASVSSISFAVHFGRIITSIYCSVGKSETVGLNRYCGSIHEKFVRHAMSQIWGATTISKTNSGPTTLTLQNNMPASHRPEVKLCFAVSS